MTAPAAIKQSEMTRTYTQERLAQIRKEQEDQLRESALLAELKSDREFRKLSKAEVEEQSLAASIAGYVYFIKSAGLVKIGFSSDVLSRLSNLRVGCPVDSKLVAAIPGTEDTELYFHKMFAKLRERGEWFRAEGMLAEMLKRMPTSVTLPERVKRHHDRGKTIVL
ncbi:hypothetical protein D9M72_303960 [compost metagenome]